MAMMQSKQVGGHSCPPSPLRNFYSYSGNKLNIQLCYPSKDFSFLLFSRSLHYNQGESPAMRHPCLEAQLSPPRSPYMTLPLALMIQRSRCEAQHSIARHQQYHEASLPSPKPTVGYLQEPSHFVQPWSALVGIFRFPDPTRRQGSASELSLQQR
ncbi:NADH-ubiquinone oxidoreductase 17.8 kDa subunit [Fusarium oxysporum f. sp. albedinis]|nr:NADH-ubiquinone oxidoreductase 17.8 kDa subunit [Fusarium oxysporum f. sp. albedinis]